MENIELNDQIKELNKVKLAVLEIKKNYTNIKASQLKKDVKNMIEILDKIYEEIFNNSKSLKSFRLYGEFYLPTISKLIEKYNYFKEKNVQTKDAVDLLKNIEIVIPKLNVHLENKYNSFFESELIDLDAEIKVLMQELGNK